MSIGFASGILCVPKTFCDSLRYINNYFHKDKLADLLIFSYFRLNHICVCHLRACSHPAHSWEYTGTMRLKL